MEHLRTLTHEPYLPGKGPILELTLWDSGSADWRGQTQIAYQLDATENGQTETIFEGSDFAGSPLHADDSDATVGALLSFLSLRPGDTDAEYFESYTERQLEFADSYGDALSMWAMELEGV
jgi:hypothetical protein